MKRVLLVLVSLAAFPLASHAQTPPAWELQWGTYGSGPGQFNLPSGLGHDAAGNVYVADMFNDRVQVFTSTGELTRTLGGSGSGPGQFYGPDDVAVAPSGDVYVADYGNFRISVWSAAGTYLREFATRLHPGSIELDPSGQHLYVMFTDGTLQKVTTAGDSVTSWPATENGGMRGFAVSPTGAIYVGSGASCAVRWFSADGVPLGEWIAPAGNQPGQCSQFDAVALDADQHLFVTGTDGRIQVFRLDGSFITEWGAIGPDPGEFSGTVPDVFVDSHGGIYVLDAARNRVQKFADATTAVRRASWGDLKLMYR